MIPLQPSIRIAEVSLGAPEARGLLDELSDTLEAITGSSGRASFDGGEVEAGGMFLLARDELGAPVACGALRRLDAATGEIKRMFAKVSGTGQQVLAALELGALEAGYRRLVLETRRVNCRAVRFYTRHGYRPIGNYGRYVGRPECICFEKRLVEVSA